MSIRDPSQRASVRQRQAAAVVGPMMGMAGCAMPVGAVIAFAGRLGAEGGAGTPFVTDSIETWGWMPCDGRSLAVGDYLELFAFIGYQYTPGKPDPDKGDPFMVPDLRGYFLRGADLEGHVDLDAKQRTPLGQGAGNDVGSRQDDALQNHGHGFAEGGVLMSAPQPPQLSGVVAQALPAAVDVNGKVHACASETRPKNVSMHYLIRFTNRI